MGSWAVKVRHREMALAQGHNWLGREPACTDTQMGMCMCRERQKCGSRWLLKENCQLVRQFIVIKEKWSFSDPLRGPVALLLLSLSTLFHHFLQHWDINGVIISQPSLSDVSSTRARDNQSLNNFWNSQMDPFQIQIPQMVYIEVHKSQVKSQILLSLLREHLSDMHLCILGPTQPQGPHCKSHVMNSNDCLNATETSGDGRGGGGRD